MLGKARIKEPEGLLLVLIPDYSNLIPNRAVGMLP